MTLRRSRVSLEEQKQALRDLKWQISNGEFEICDL
jgi:hypothetical protein